ncbi:glycosyltransferase family 9 protein [Dermatobacter hominis]|uniref:glycosyltransferase family 9 protein n=1 Tax=Dermatobacter hominis TaxID=2884263 RepID=UPI001D0F840E|nr:glycosyltransferase family 9 protein [Dermatobacter hominis]UDY37494.1 glycosyltransferase family 9 protein [Dermatobacter hominis]
MLVVRLDNAGDVLLSGPAVRALSERSEVVYAASPRGLPAARLLPGVTSTIAFEAPWIAAQPPPVDEAAIERFVAEVRAAGVDRAVVLTSFHQSALPTALLLRLAGVARIEAISDDYPGSLLDLRHRVPDDLHEVRRALSLVAAGGDALGPGDDGRLRVEVPAPPREADHVVVHPGASVPARTLRPEVFADAVRELTRRGRRVLVTGAASEADLVRSVAADVPGAVASAGELDLAGLAVALGRAAAVVVGNTGPAHLAAAVGTPVVSAFPPTVPWERWRPWGVATERLGDQDVDCAGCRARSCPEPTQHCLAGVDGVAVADAVDRLVARTVEARVGA